MPREYLKIRDRLYSGCLNGKHRGKEPGETCLQWAKRVGSMIYRSRHGKSPQEAESEIELLETVEELLGLVKDEGN